MNQRLRQVGFARAGRAVDQQIPPLADKIATSQQQELLATDVRIERKIKRIMDPGIWTVKQVKIKS